MPVHKVTRGNKTGFQWGKSGKVYFGKNAKKKATTQARAIYASGYKKR